MTEVLRPSIFAGLKVHQATDITDQGMCIAIYGSAGTGKTTLAAGAADVKEGGRTLILDAEGGAKAVAHRTDIDVIDINDWPQLRRFAEELVRADVIPWDTIILDNMTEYQSVNMRDILKQAGRDMTQIQDFNRNTIDMLTMTRTMRDIARKRGINVILIAWDSPEKDETTGFIKRDVGFTPSLARQFPGIVDIVGYLTVENDPPRSTRHLSFTVSPRTAAKFRRSKNENAMKIPLELWFGENNNLMADIISTLRYGKPFDAAKYSKPEKARS